MWMMWRGFRRVVVHFFLGCCVVVLALGVLILKVNEILRSLLPYRNIGKVWIKTVDMICGLVLLPIGALGWVLGMILGYLTGLWGEELWKPRKGEIGGN